MPTRVYSSRSYGYDYVLWQNYLKKWKNIHEIILTISFITLTSSSTCQNKYQNISKKYEIHPNHVCLLIYLHKSIFSSIDSTIFSSLFNIILIYMRQKKHYLCLFIFLYNSFETRLLFKVNTFVSREKASYLLSRYSKIYSMILFRFISYLLILFNLFRPNKFISDLSINIKYICQQEIHWTV